MYWVNNKVYSRLRDDHPEWFSPKNASREGIKIYLEELSVNLKKYIWEKDKANFLFTDELYSYFYYKR